MYIYTDPICLEHETPQGHPERPDRLRALLSYFEDSGITDDHPLLTPAPATQADLLRAHPQVHLDFLQSLQPLSDESGAQNLVPVDPDTWMGPTSMAAAAWKVACAS